MWYIFLIIGILLGSLSIYFILRPSLQSTVQYNKDIEEQNNQLFIDNKRLTQEASNLSQTLSALTTKREEVANSLDLLQETANNSAQLFYEQAVNTAQTNIELAIEALGRQYEDASKNYEIEYQDLLNSSAEALNSQINEKQELLKKLDDQIANIKKTFEAAREAKKREQLITSKPEDFTLNLSTADLADIKKLFILKNDLNNPRVLLMLIWTSFIKRPLDVLTERTFGTTDCGIYKLTNILTEEVYIGQSVQMHERMRQHFKCGLGIDAANNKLYQNMQQYGVWNFSIELLESCPREQLDDKEKFYIELYKADTSLNSTKGNNQK